MARINRGNYLCEGKLKTMTVQREEPSLEVAEEDKVTDEDDETRKSKQDERSKEWGQQFDIWLIRAAKKARMVEIPLVYPIPGITKEGNVLAGIPKRIDRYMVQFDVDGQEVWVNKQFFIACKSLVAAKKEQSDLPAME